MHNPNDDPDVTSGTTDGAQMETTPAPAVPHKRNAGRSKTHRGGVTGPALTDTLGGWPLGLGAGARWGMGECGAYWALIHV